MMAQPLRTRLPWWPAAAVGVLLAVIAAVVIILLFPVWFVVMPAWAVLVLGGAGICLAVSSARPAALGYGIAILASMPLGIVLAIAFLAIAVEFRP